MHNMDRENFQDKQQDRQQGNNQGFQRNNFDPQQFNFDQFQKDIRNFIEQAGIKFTPEQNEAFARNFPNKENYFKQNLQQNIRRWYGEPA
jgi:hypothetical protein